MHQIYFKSLSTIFKIWNTAKYPDRSTNWHSTNLEKLAASFQEEKLGASSSEINEYQMVTSY